MSTSLGSKRSGRYFVVVRASHPGINVTPPDLDAFFQYLQRSGYTPSTSAAYCGGVRRVLRALPHPSAVGSAEAVQGAMDRAHARLSYASRVQAEAGWDAYVRYRPTAAHHRAPLSAAAPEWFEVVGALRRAGGRWGDIARVQWSHVSPGARYSHVSLPDCASLSRVVLGTDSLNAMAAAASPEGQVQGDWQLCCVGQPPAWSPARVIAKAYRQDRSPTKQDPPQPEGCGG